MDFIELAHMTEVRFDVHIKLKWKFKVVMLIRKKVIYFNSWRLADALIQCDFDHFFLLFN